MKKTLVLALSLFAAACGDDNSGDTPTDAGSDTTPEDMMVVEDYEKAVVVSGDYGSVGALAELNVEEKTVEQNAAPATSVGGDPVVRKFGNELFVVNRNSGNSVTILKASDYSLVEMVGVGAGSNPQDVAVVGNTVYVVTYTEMGLKYFTRGSSTINTIDLSADDPDGKPNCSSIYAVGTKLFVACQLLDNTDPFLAPRADSRVYVVDTATKTKVGTLTLDTVNPFSLFAQLPTGAQHAGDLVVGTVKFADGTGCIERISTGNAPAAEGCLFTNAEIGGNVTRLDVSASKLYVRASRADGTGFIKTATLSNSTLDAGELTGATESTGDMTICPSGTIVTTAQRGYDVDDMSPQGLRVYSSTGTLLTATPLDFGIAPVSQWGLACY